jgi:hypothetical protein
LKALKLLATSLLRLDAEVLRKLIADGEISIVVKNGAENGE